MARDSNWILSLVLYLLLVGCVGMSSNLSMIFWNAKQGRMIFSIPPQRFEAPPWQMTGRGTNIETTGMVVSKARESQLFEAFVHWKTRFGFWLLTWLNSVTASGKFAKIHQHLRWSALSEAPDKCSTTSIGVHPSVHFWKCMAGFRQYLKTDGFSPFYTLTDNYILGSSLDRKLPQTSIPLDSPNRKWYWLFLGDFGEVLRVKWESE